MKKTIGIDPIVRLCPPGYEHVSQWAARFGIDKRRAKNWAMGKVALHRVGKYYFVAKLLLVLLALQSAPAFADDAVVPVPAFRFRHPKVYKCYRRTRHVCICVKPIIDVGGATAQMVMLFTGR